MVIVALAIVAFVLIRGLMWVVSHEEGGTALAGAAPEPHVELRVSPHEEARSLLLPAAETPAYEADRTNAFSRATGES